MSEKAVENQIKRWIKSLGGWFIKIQGGCNNPSTGVPDILACIDGHFIAIEVKRPYGGIVTEIQKQQIAAINRAGGVALVATSVDEVEFELTRNGIIKTHS